MPAQGRRSGASTSHYEHAPIGPMIQDDQPRPSAAEKVLSMPELLEKILAELPGLNDPDMSPADLLRCLLMAQSVSKFWRALIQSSPRLRRLLFLEPAAPVLYYVKWEYEDKGMYSPSVNFGKAIRGPDDNVVVPRYAPHWGVTREDSGRHEIFFNPLLAKRFAILSPTGVHEGTHLYNEPALSQRDACWRKMLITQPPIHTVFLEWDRDNLFFQDASPGWTVARITREAGEFALTAPCVLKQLRASSSTAWLEGSSEWKPFKGEESLESIRKRVKKMKKESITHLSGSAGNGQ